MARFGFPEGRNESKKIAPALGLRWCDLRLVAVEIATRAASERRKIGSAHYRRAAVYA
jgi:hypothetical protein